jgi:hypothetical protein
VIYFSTWRVEQVRGCGKGGVPERSRREWWLRLIDDFAEQYGALPKNVPV